MLMQFQLDGLANEPAYARAIRDWLASNHSIAARRRVTATPRTR
jgi:hypothetical protein